MVAFLIDRNDEKKKKMEALVPFFLSKGHGMGRRRDISYHHTFVEEEGKEKEERRKENGGDVTEGRMTLVGRERMEKGLFHWEWNICMYVSIYVSRHRTYVNQPKRKQTRRAKRQKEEEDTGRDERKRETKAKPQASLASNSLVYFLPFLASLFVFCMYVFTHTLLCCAVLLCTIFFVLFLFLFMYLLTIRLQIDRYTNHIYRHTTTCVSSIDDTRPHPSFLSIYLSIYPRPSNPTTHIYIKPTTTITTDIRRRRDVCLHR